MLKFIDLFAGIGGLRLGFENACKSLEIKSKCVLSSEINSKSCETYYLNFGESPKGDIHLINDIEDFDFLLGGFPCQPFSHAGKQLGFGDTRGTLFYEIERILLAKKPKAFLLENVRGLQSHDKGRTLETIISHLENAGYGVRYILANSSDYGVPQNRLRIYIFGILNDKPKFSLRSDNGAADTHKYKQNNNQPELFSKKNNACFLRSILEDNPDPKYNCSPKFTQMLSNVVGKDFNKLHGVRLIDFRGGNSIHSWELGIKGKCYSDEINFMNLLISNRRKKMFGVDQDGKMLTIDQIKTFYPNNNLKDILKSLLDKGYLKQKEGKYNPVCGNMSFEIFKFLDPDSIAITLVSSDAHKLGVVQNDIPRRLTPRECARLQSFPDSFILNPVDSLSYMQLGNSVTVKVVEAISKDILTCNKEYFNFQKSYSKA